jgi:hypothetical protein
MRNTTCSNDPAGIVRTSTRSTEDSAIESGATRRVCDPVDVITAGSGEASQPCKCRNDTGAKSPQSRRGPRQVLHVPAIARRQYRDSHQTSDAAAGP